MDLPGKLRAFQSNEPGFPTIFGQAADEIERLRAALVRIGILNASGKNYDPEIDKIIRSIAVSPEAPGHTDLMVTPESLDEYLEKNPPPDDVGPKD